MMDFRSLARNRLRSLAGALGRALAAGVILGGLAGQGFAQSAALTTAAPATLTAALTPAPASAQLPIVAPLIQVAPVAADPNKAHAVPQPKPQPQLQVSAATPTTSAAKVPPANQPANPSANPQAQPPAIQIVAKAGDPLAPDAPPVPPAVPMTRDAGLVAADAASVEGWQLPLVPALQPVPADVRIGGSMPAPGHFRLSGEVAGAEFILTLPEGVTPAHELALALRSSANVLPDHSKLTVWVNGTETGSVALDNIADFAEKRVPVSGLVAGDNKIRISVIQQHRIFCGPDASFGVWTEVNLGQSGATVDPATVPLTSQGFLAALRSQVAGNGAVEVRADPKTDGGMVRAVANQVIAALGAAPLVRVQPFYTVQSGPMAKARVALIAAARPKVSFQRGAGGAIVLQVEYSGAAVPDLTVLLPVAVRDTATAALTPGRTTTLAELGAPAIIGNTHYFRQDVNFVLPDDWLLLASQKAAFTLHYGFSADLAKGALLLVKVNGQTTRLLPLDVGGGEVLPPLSMTFAANGLNPGINTLTFEMTVPGDPPELPCTPRKTDLLVILGDSTLTVPPSPKMRQDDIARSLARLDGTGIVIPSEAADPAHDAATLTAFGSLFRPLTAAGSPVRLHIVGVDFAGILPKGSTDVTRQILQAAVSPRIDAVLPLAKPTAAPAASVKTPAFTLSNGDTRPALLAPLPAPDTGTFWQEMLRPWTSDGWIGRPINSLRDVVFPGSTSLARWLRVRSGVALLLQLDPATPDDIWLIAGPDLPIAKLAVQVDLLRRTGHHALQGQAMLLQHDGTWVSWTQNRSPELLEPLTLSNLRVVLGNYASWSPALFTVMTLLFALFSVIPALVFVLITRRNGSRI